jgi:two-component system, sensor histidine kinase and response regulator
MNAEAMSTSTAALAGPRILVADDVEVNRDFIAATLAELSPVFEFASNGFAAVALVELHRFDLIFTDVQMPAMDGVEAVRLIRLLPNGRDVPIIAVTGNAFDEERQRCVNAGFNDVVTKPIVRKRLMEVAEKWLRAPHDRAA